MVKIKLLQEKKRKVFLFEIAFFTLFSLMCNMHLGFLCLSLVSLKGALGPLYLRYHSLMSEIRWGKNKCCHTLKQSCYQIIGGCSISFITKSNKLKVSLTVERTKKKE